MMGGRGTAIGKLLFASLPPVMEVVEAAEVAAEVASERACGRERTKLAMSSSMALMLVGRVPREEKWEDKERRICKIQPKVTGLEWHMS